MVGTTEPGLGGDETGATLVERLQQENEAMRLEVVEARHRLLVNRDHVVGTEAEIGRLNRDVMRLQVELNESRKKVRALQTRKRALQDKVSDLQGKLATTRARVRTLSGQLEQRPVAAPSFTRRVARRLRGGRR